MPIDFRLQYQEDTSQSEVAYTTAQSAGRRIADIHGTSRKKISRERGGELWQEFFEGLWNEREHIPGTREDFENWIRTNIRKLSEILGGENELKIGLAQKFVNLFLKDLWAFQEVSEDTSELFHIPLDAIVLACFTDYSENWKSWTKVVAVDDTRFDCRYRDYMDIQMAHRRYAADFGFLKPLELEQLFWHKIIVEQVGAGQPATRSESE